MLKSKTNVLLLNVLDIDNEHENILATCLLPGIRISMYVGL